MESLVEIRKALSFKPTAAVKQAEEAALKRASSRRAALRGTGRMHPGSIEAQTRLSAGRAKMWPGQRRVET